MCYIQSLTLKDFPDRPQISATPWLTQISDNFKGDKLNCLKALHFRGLVVSDQDLELLANTFGNNLRALKICSCRGFSEQGLVHVSRYCNNLTSLCLEYDEMDGDQTGEWLRELALRNTPIESLHFRCLFNDLDDFDVEDLTLVARTCSSSLVSLKIGPKPLNDLRNAFSHAINLQDFDGVFFDKDGDYNSFMFPPSIRGLGIWDLPGTSFSFLLPYAKKLRELNLTSLQVSEEYCACFLIERCPNLEVLRTNDVCGDSGLRVIGHVCKKLRKLIHLGGVTQMGLIDLVQGCTSLEVLDVKLSDISYEAIECVGTHLKNLRDFRMKLLKKGTNLPLDNGIRAMLKGCIELKMLTLVLCDEELTDVGMGYVGKYGNNLRYLFLGCKGVSDGGLLELSKGCPRLRKLSLYFWDCPFSEQVVTAFVFSIHSLRYVCFSSGFKDNLALTHPTFTAEVILLEDNFVFLAF